MRSERLKIIQKVRDKSAAVAEIYAIEDLARVKIHTNVEVCTLLDEIDQLTSALEKMLKFDPTIVNDKLGAAYGIRCHVNARIVLGVQIAEHVVLK